MEPGKNFPEFITFTCLRWKNVIERDDFKYIITDSLNFLTKHQRIWVYAFVIMPNHFHLIWQIRERHKREHVQRDFLKHVSQTMLRILKAESSPLVRDLEVKAVDRVYQVWKRNSLAIPLWSLSVFFQKFDYIHRNPVRAKLCLKPEDYKFSSAAFYKSEMRGWEFLRHYKEYRDPRFEETNDRD